MPYGYREWPYEELPPEGFSEYVPAPVAEPPPGSIELCPGCKRPYDLSDYSNDDDLLCTCPAATATNYKDAHGTGKTCNARSHIICTYPTARPGLFHYFPKLVLVKRRVEAGQVENVTPWGTPTELSEPSLCYLYPAYKAGAERDSPPAKKGK